MNSLDEFKEMLKTALKAAQDGDIAGAEAIISTALKPKKPSTIAQQVADAQAEYDTWSPERKASVRLQGGSQPAAQEPAAPHVSEGESVDGDRTAQLLKDGEKYQTIIKLRLKRSGNSSLGVPCACEFDEDGETLLRCCSAHKAIIDAHTARKCAESRVAALEEAARTCDNFSGGHNYNDAWGCAEDIRALIR